MASLQINLYSAPWSNRSQLDALAFAQAWLKAGLTIERVFFFMDAVYTGLTNQALACDEIDIRQGWLDLQESCRCELLLCVAAATNRGLINDADAQQQTQTMAPFELAGLGQWAMGFRDGIQLMSFR